MVSREQKQEASVPVQGRIDIVTLAELDLYWDSSGVRMMTMSQLLSWSVGLLRETLATNGKLPVTIETVAEAHKYLEERKLYQAGMRKRSMKKIANAMSLESMRDAGIDPKEYASSHYNQVHNARSVEPLPKVAGLSPLAEKAMETYNKLYGDGPELTTEEKIEQARKEALEREEKIDKMLDSKHLVKESGKSTEAEIDALNKQQEERDKGQVQAMKEAEPDAGTIIKSV